MINTAGVTLTFADEKLEADELDVYVKSAECRRQLYRQLAEENQSAAISSSVDLAMNLPPNEVFEAASHSFEAVSKVALEAIWNQLPDDHEWNATKDIAHDIGPSGSGPANLLASCGRTLSSGAIQRGLESKIREQKIQHIESDKLRFPRRLNRLVTMLRHANGFASAMANLRALSQLEIQDRDQLAQLSEDERNQIKRAYRAAVNDLQQQIAKAFEPWLDSNAIQALFDDRIPKRNLALIRALADLTGEHMPLVGVVRRNAGGVDDDIVIDNL